MTTASDTITAKIRQDLSTGFDIEKVGQDFPILREKVEPSLRRF